MIGNVETLGAELKVEALPNREDLKQRSADNALIRALTNVAWRIAKTVTVSGEVPALQTDSSTGWHRHTGKLVQDLPLNGRNFVELALLVPGVSPGPPNGLATGTRPDERRLNSSFSVNGQDPVANNNLIDGMFTLKLLKPETSMPRE